MGTVSSVGKAADLESHPRQQVVSLSKTLGSKGAGFEPHPRQRVVSLGKTLYPYCSTAEVGDATPIRALNP